MDLEEGFYCAQTRWPYYARAFAALIPVERASMPTLGVDSSWRLYWSRKALDRFGSALPVVLLHEVEHLLRDHGSRTQERQKHLWNIACDAEINDDIEGLPADAVMPSNLKQANGLAAEDYYRSIPEGENSSGGCAGGSGVTGQREGWEEAPAENDSEGVVGQQGADNLRNQVAADVVASKQRGEDISLGICMWAEARLTAKPAMLPSWRPALSRWFRDIQRGSVDWSWSRLSRRQQERVLHPGLIAPTVSIGVVVDTSGSCEGHGEWVASVFRALLLSRVNATIFPCDLESKPPFKLVSVRDTKKCSGGGGTDLRAGIAEASKKHANVLVLTDGYTPWPEHFTAQTIALIRDGVGPVKIKGFR